MQASRSAKDAAHTMNWALIYNPTAGRFRARGLRSMLEPVVEALAAAGIEAQPVPTAAPGHATELAREARGVDCVAVLGGDGTLREAAAGLLGRELPLAFLPAGTANVMAHELGLPQHPLRALEALLQGEVQAVHPGLVNGRPFLLMAGFGYDGRVVHGVRPRIKAWSGKGAYLLSGLSSLLAPLPRLEVELQGGAGGGASPGGHWVVAARARHYGGPYVIHPRAGLQRDALGLVTVERGSLLPFLVGRLGFEGRLGRYSPSRGVKVLESSGFTVRSVRSEQPMHVQVDGDYLGQGSEFEIGIAPQPVLMRVPPGWTGGA